MENTERFFEELYKDKYDMISKYVRRVVNDSDAVEDIVQETFFAAYVKREILMSHPNVDGWLYITAKNKILKWNEKQKRYSYEHEFVLENAVIEEGSKVDEFKMVEIYSSVVDTLSDEELGILRNYYEYGYTSQEMAKRLGITEACFKVRVLRMKQKLRNSFTLFFLIVTMVFRR